VSDLALLGGERVVESGSVGSNPWAYKNLEDAIVRYTGARYALPVNSGTSAIASGLHAAGVGPGDEVITVAHSWIAHVAAIFQFNAIPVFADVDRATYTIDVADVERKITPRTRAILPVDIYGLPANIPALMALAERHGITVVEDACQAGGAEIDGRKVGSIAHCTAFSFGGKPLSGWGTGVMTTNDHRLYQRAVLAGQMGPLILPRVTDEDLRRNVDFPGRGQNMRMLGLQAAAVLHDMYSADPRIDARIANCEYLTERLADVPGVSTPRAPAGYKHVYHIYTGILDTDRLGFGRNLFLQALAAEGVPVGAYVTHCSLHYYDDDSAFRGMEPVESGPIHWRSYFQDLDYHGKGCPWSCGHTQRIPDYSRGSLPVTEYLVAREFCLRQPTLSYPNGEREMALIVDAIRKVIEHADDLRRVERERAPAPLVAT
jgi:dTDP-4-amino-4,6-dideoxygalactose transaminase